MNLALLLTQLLFVLAATRLAGGAARVIGQPRVIGEMAAGLALGPSLLGAVSPAALQRLFPADQMIPLATISQVGVVLFMFVVGLRFDAGLLRGSVTSTVAISYTSIALPFAMGSTLGVWLYPQLAGADTARLPFVLFLGTAMSITAFPVLARILEERGLLQTRIGSVALACAAVDDVMAWCLLAGLLAVVRAGDTVSTFALTLLAAAAVAAALATAVRSWLQSWNRRRIAQGLSVSAEAVGLTLLIALASALATEMAGVHALFGAFLAGVVVPREAALAATIADRVDSVIGTTMLPVFFAFTGLRTDIGLVVASDLWLVFALILLVAVSGKYIRRQRSRQPIKSVQFLTGQE